MIYTKNEIIRRLNVALATEQANVKREHDAAMARVNQEATQQQVDDLYTDITKYMGQSNWRRVADTAYKLYQKAGEMTRGNGQPNFSTRDQHQRKVAGIESMIALLESGQSDNVSTSELEKLGILPLIRYVQ